MHVMFTFLQVQNLSGGELQRVALALCLGKPADVYLIDEPSAYLDSEQRLHAAKVIKRYRGFKAFTCRCFKLRYISNDRDILVWFVSYF